MRKLILLPLLVALAGVAHAQHGPDGPGAPPPGGPLGGAPSPEMLAQIPGLGAAQQIEVRKILIARRDAHDALRDKERTEHEHIDDQSAERLRKLLGDDGYRVLAQSMAPHGPGRDSPPHGEGRGRPDRDGPGDPPKPPQPPIPAPK